MDGGSRQQSEPISWRDRDGPWLVVLIGLVAALRGWLLVTTVVCARDSVGFVRYALTFDEKTWSNTLLAQHQHPGYPIAIWAVSKPLRAVWGTTPEIMTFSAQLVSAAAAVALACVMYFLGKRLWDRFIGFFAALLFQVLPTSGHHLSDGISDGLFLLLCLCALLHLIRAWETASTRRYALSGVFIGLAYLTRPEGLLILPAAWLFALYMLGRPPFPRASLPQGGLSDKLRQTGIGLAAVTFTCALAGAPYYLATGQITRKPSVRQMIVVEDAAIAEQPHAGGHPLFASLFAGFFAPAGDFSGQLYRSVRALLNELCQAFHYGGVFLLLVGLIFGGISLARHAGVALLVVYALLHVTILLRLGYTVSYVSDRHVMIVVAMACFPCVIGAERLAGFVLSWTKRLRGSIGDAAGESLCRVAAAALMALTFIICIGKTLQPLHANRIGNHAAGRWLAGVMRPGDRIEDEYCWSQYYAGQMTDSEDAISPADGSPVKYVVITRRRDGVQDAAEKLLADVNPRVVFHWPASAPMDQARVLVYAMPHSFISEPWTRAAGASSFRAVSRTIDD